MEKRYKYILFKIVSFPSVYVAIEKSQKMSLGGKIDQWEDIVGK